ncbi:MAG: PKD domain-containing protein, partial [Flavobacteriales bacterium]|nr:PKD domain-containing protein [Flavobacteriales bacterium]
MTIHRPLLLIGLALLCHGTYAQESCANAVDDDGDGLTDLNDTTDCACGVTIGGGGIPSILPNASFEDYDCMPASYSQLDCADGWDQATFATSDYFLAPGYMPPWIPQPLPGGGSGCVGGYFCHDYMEYIGGCLLAPMEAGTSYSLNMSMAAFEIDNFLSQTTTLDLSPVNVTIYGFASCPPMPTSIALCPGTEGWTELGYATYTPSNEWGQITITFTPTFDVAAIMIGSPCTLPADYPNVFDPWLAYFIFDNLTLNESSLFGSTIDESGEFYTEDLTLTGHPDTIANSYQWFYEGVALIGQTDTILGISINDLDTGWYQFVSYFDTACVVSEIHVDPPVCVPALIANVPVSSCDPITFQFENGSDTSQVISIEWDFGDGSPTSTAYEPSHPYSIPGTYDVTLSLLSDDYCPTDTTYTTLITIDQIPEPTFTADLFEGCIGMTVNFSNTTDTLTGDCSWAFGDGGSANVCDPSHTYAIADTFSVTLTVTSAAGCTEDTTLSDLIIVYAEPQVSFTTDTVAGCTPLTIHYTNTTPAGQIGSVEWDLGNGTVTDQDDPVGVYTDAGIYSVSLLVTHPLGCSAEVEEDDLITAYGHPVVSFTNQPDSGCYPLEVQFINTTDALFTNECYWSFGNGDSSALCLPTYTYQDPGVYSVSLRVISPQNCDGDTTYTDLITVFDHPEAAFVFGPQPTDYFETYISFFDSSSVDAIEWDWEFGVDGVLGTSQDEFPTLHFPGNDLGTYPVRLIVTNVHTCTDTMIRNVVIDGYYVVYAPNAFTPDGDGVNDLWRPLIKDQEDAEYQLTIFDRWGQEIWASTDPAEGWEGKSG